MDPEVAALASAAATAVITAMAKEGWEGVRTAVSRLWRREPADRVEHITAALEHSRQELAGVPEPLAESTQVELVAEWQARLRRLLAAHPELAGEVAAIVRLEDRPDGGVAFGPVQHHGTGDVNQAGRDLTITRSPRRLDD